MNYVELELVIMSSISTFFSFFLCIQIALVTFAPLCSVAHLVVSSPKYSLHISHR